MGKENTENSLEAIFDKDKLTDALLNKDNPCHEEIVSVALELQAWLQNIPDIENKIKTYQVAWDEADRYIELARTGTVGDFCKIKPIHGITLLAVMAKMDSQARERARLLFKSRQSEIASKPRVGNKDKLAIKALWETWSKDENNEGKPITAFIARARKITGTAVKDQTIRNWIAQWKEANS